ncbi:hypothetical protein B0T24DRAFT_599266 [Lasiosphaeria ovina]|uniref:Uncharacterized protein n=1 Tax=Lasiosphaeria ovina TaxID=92902 RepID=A0AAE0JUT3_9PEZI|nr:hypothetical protein B0T24DRAFT_599266 [Lasiosphaeria ovina]
MASIRAPPPTYHVVPRFDIAAQGGALELGTVVDSLLMLRPLNRGAVVPIPAKLRYAPTTQSGFAETRSRLREGHGGVWARSLIAQGVGASASASAQSETTSKVACDAIVTTYFDPDRAYVARSLASGDVSEHFAGSGYEDDVYLVTGLKVAKKLRYSSSTSAQRAASAEVAACEPHTGTEIGAGAGGSSDNAYTVGFDVDDVVVGFRVRRYAYVPASAWNPLSKKKRLEGSDYLENASMHEEVKEDIAGPEASYEQVPIEEEVEAQNAATISGETDECWVDST